MAHKVLHALPLVILLFPLVISHHIPSLAILKYTWLPQSSMLSQTNFAFAVLSFPVPFSVYVGGLTPSSRLSSSL